MSDMAAKRNYLESGEHLSMRREIGAGRWAEIESRLHDPGLPLDMRAAHRLKLFLAEERAVWLEGDSIPAWRTIISFPDIYAPGEFEELTRGRYVHEQGRVCNISSDWEGVLKNGLDGRAIGPAQRMCVDAVIEFADRFNDSDLSRSVRSGATGYLSALKLFRILHFCLWASNVYHNTVGRFDQYMYPFYLADISSGALDRETALNYTEELFLSFNRDSDLYQGMQQGDNGQSLMLGGCDPEGGCAVNELTYICLEASLHNRRIDPKINLRVDKNTPIELYRLCTELTRQGLGFPQYSNDDAVIPALVEFGYDLEDARNYTVAACWEFIIPGVGMDIPNIAAVSLPGAVLSAAKSGLESAGSYEEFFDLVKGELVREADKIERAVRPIFMEPAPYQSVLMKSRERDISEGGRYNNYGVHGNGFATAVDSLAAIKKYVFDEKCVTPGEYLAALGDNFESAPELRHALRKEAPKLGRDDECGAILNALIFAFADSLHGRRNERGGIFRPGTGSAMYYLWHGKDLPATPDGRCAGEVLSANFTPSPLISKAGPLSVITAMARGNTAPVMNGGPLTLELHDTVLRNQEGMDKVAMLVRSFVQMGGHQLQLNTINREALIRAQNDPAANKNLIVRVWGWSGQFVNLDKGYQDQIIERASYMM